MRTGGVPVPINGDVVICCEHRPEGDCYVVRTFPESTDGDVYRTHDEAMAAATALAARAQVSVFLTEGPHPPMLVKPFRAF